MMITDNMMNMLGLLNRMYQIKPKSSRRMYSFLLGTMHALHLSFVCVLFFLQNWIS